MDATIDTREQLTSAVREAAAKLDGLEGPIRIETTDGQHRVPPTTVRVCPQGDHLAVAHRWENRCDRCGQGIISGAVGLHTHFGDERQPRCVDGNYDWQHQCGEVMPPTERVLDLHDDETIERLERAAERARQWAHEVGEQEHEAVADAIADLGERIVDETIVALHREVGEEQHEAAGEVRRRLLGELNEALRQLADGADPEDVADGDDMEPGVQIEDGEPLAWDHDPTDPDGPPILVTPADFDLVGAAEVARLAGLSERSVRTYVTRGTIVHPVPVAGSDALVWRRTDVLDWLDRRPGRGRPT
jgi:predicted DNA-binding transcriptional regulator AlpA